MAFKLISGPGAEPVSLVEAKLHLRVDGADDDALIGALIQAAREQCEHETGRALVSQTWELVLDAFPAAEIRIGKSPVQSIASVKYLDEQGDEQTLSSGAYVLDADTEPGWLMLAAGAAWPSTASVSNAVRIRFVAGYGASSAEVPAGIRHWMLLRIGTGYKLREQFVAGASLAALPGNYADRLLDGYRAWV